ncbi:ABC transporter substrate-binding protein [Paenibacillus sp. N3/727]|uniref:ABC transporter substrate-binding protein n=1 Tax=Paenibacillus sp. N3/727 TaxID=2925845 RepID=UPI001F52BC5B|nr:ABC transporter substrate-binding protein [Paenibacillus sp. N3/727]UNK18342.1 ABC transporter substrate-binding protein [Paenibacillus sp. N3/727]
MFKRNIKRSGSWLLMLCMLLFLAACSSEGANSTSTNEVKEEQTSEQPAEQKTAEQKTDDQQTEKEANKTRIISTVTGDVEVPTHPERVIVDWDLGHVLALGVEPVGASKTILEYGRFLEPYVTDQTQDIGGDGQVSVEKMLALNPDLIITWDPKMVEQYSKVAPTVVYDTAKYDNIHEEITAMGEILNRQKEAEEWLSSFDKRVEAAKEKIKGVIPEDATFSIIDVATTKSTIVVGESGERGGDALYQILGVTPQPRVKSDIIDKGEIRLDVSWEKVGDYAGDYVFMVRNGEGSELELPSVWNSLDAVKNKRVYELDMKKYFTSDPLSALLQAEEMAALLTGGQK